jgi:hypothetical protein
MFPRVRATSLNIDRHWNSRKGRNRRSIREFHATGVPDTATRDFGGRLGGWGRSEAKPPEAAVVRLSFDVMHRRHSPGAAFGRPRPPGAIDCQISVLETPR